MLINDERQLPLTSFISTTYTINYKTEYQNQSNLHCMIFLNIYLLLETKSFLYTGLQSNYSKQSISIWNWSPKPCITQPFYHLSIKWKKKKNHQHFIESIHESILLSGKQCTWMKVNDFPVSPSNQYSLYKLMLLLNVCSVNRNDRYVYM